jgi:hypothetical protein
MSSAENAIPVDGPVEADRPQTTGPSTPITPDQEPPEIEEENDNNEALLFPDATQDELESPPAYEAGGRLIRTIPTKGSRYTLRRWCALPFGFMLIYYNSILYQVGREHHTVQYRRVPSMSSLQSKSLAHPERLGPTLPPQRPSRSHRMAQSEKC